MNKYLTSISKSVLLTGAIILTGCAGIPKSIQGTSATPATDFLAVHNAPELYKGLEGRFGGRVLNVTNEPNKTRLEIGVMALSSDASPVLNSAVIGRIYAYVNSFLEPSNFTNQYITVVGKIGAMESGKIGNIDYNYLVINVTGLQRWIPQEQIIMPAPMYGPNPWGGWSNPYGAAYPAWGWYHPIGPAPVQTYLVPN